MTDQRFIFTEHRAPVPERDLEFVLVSAPRGFTSLVFDVGGRASTEEDLIAALQSAPEEVRERIGDAVFVDGSFHGFVLSGDHARVVAERDEAIYEGNRLKTALHNEHEAAVTNLDLAHKENESLERAMAEWKADAQRHYEGCRRFERERDHVVRDRDSAIKERDDAQSARDVATSELALAREELRNVRGSRVSDAERAVVEAARALVHSSARTQILGEENALIRAVRAALRGQSDQKAAPEPAPVESDDMRVRLERDSKSGELMYVQAEPPPASAPSPEITLTPGDYAAVGPDGKVVATANTAERAKQRSRAAGVLAPVIVRLAEQDPPARAGRG